jgi:hypothetical protein
MRTRGLQVRLRNRQLVWLLVAIAVPSSWTQVTQLAEARQRQQRPAFPDVDVQRDVIYKKINGLSLRLDIYSPNSCQSFSGSTEAVGATDAKSKGPGQPHGAGSYWGRRISCDSTRLRRTRRMVRAGEPSHLSSSFWVALPEQEETGLRWARERAYRIQRHSQGRSALACRACA